VLARACRFATTATVVGLAVVAAPPALAAHTPPAFAQGHPYRHGAVPLRPGAHHLGSNQAATSANNLNYGGGIQGVGVTTGAPKVYLVFWGSQWGTQGTNGQGYTTLSGDPKAIAPRLQGFFKGLGTGNELWSGVMTQYCEGVSTGAQTCPSSSAHVGYPTGGALAGVWVDESSAAPGQATGNQIGTEAVKAAGHFGNTTTASNRNTEYVVVSPTGTKPDGFNTAGGQFCAWHDYTGDSTLSGGAVNSPYGPLAFTNMPYVTDAGSSCGQNFVNSGSAGTNDGVTIVEGHEFAETVTDQFPAGGWTDSTGAENGDKCAWISSGQGASQNITLTTGTYAVQSTWGNDSGGGAGGCQISHSIVGGGGGGGNTVTVTNPGNQSSTVGTAVSLQIHASDSASGQTLTYSATGLPAGLSIGSTSGLISGTPTTAGSSSVTVSAKDTTGASGSTSFTWTVSTSGGGGCTAKQLLGNPGFETGSAAPWSATAGVINPSSAGEPAHSGTYVAWLDGYGSTHTDTLSQSVSIPAGCKNATFSYWLHIDTAESGSTAFDTLKVQVLSSSGSVLATIGSFSNVNAASGYQQHSANLAAYVGQTITLKFTGSEDSSLQTSFVVDDTALNVS
jgi:serine protease